MKKIVLFLLVMIFGSTIVFGISGERYDDENYSGDFYENIFSGEINIDENTEIMDDKDEILEVANGENIMLIGDVVNAKGAAEDLILLAGDSVNSEAIGEYGFMLANDLNISGDVLKDNFVAGKNINVIGDIGRDAYLFGATINVNGNIGRNLYIYGSEININGVVNGEINVFAERLTISSSAEISGDINIDAEYITIEDNVKIGGIVKYNSNAEEVDIPEYVKNNMNQVVDIEVKEENVVLAQIKEALFWLVINMVLFVGTILICPGLFEKINRNFKEKEITVLGTSICWGAILIIIIPIISIIALITIIGSALGFVGLLAYTVILVYSTVISGYLLGLIMFSNKSMNKYLIGIIGITVVQILRNLPVIGGIISFMLLLITFGIIKDIVKKDKEDTESDI